MLDLTFGEQVKLILSRRGMTIKELAETIEIRTGKKMSRQNLTQRLGRDNFQEQDMRMIAEILDCPFQLSILGEDGATTEKIQNRPAEPVYEKEPEAAAEEAAAEPEYAIEEPETAEPEYTEEPEETAAEEEPEDPYAEFRMSDEEDLEKGDINPYTGREYKSNSVRMHPTRIGYVQVYDRGKHTWTDMTEWAFLGYQERKKALMGKDYDPPIYLD